LVPADEVVRINAALELCAHRNHFACPVHEAAHLDWIVLDEIPVRGQVIQLGLVVCEDRNVEQGNRSFDVTLYCPFQTNGLGLAALDAGCVASLRWSTHNLLESGFVADVQI